MSKLSSGVSKETEKLMEAIKKSYAAEELVPGAGIKMAEKFMDTGKLDDIYKDLPLFQHAFEKEVKSFDKVTPPKPGNYNGEFRPW